MNKPTIIIIIFIVLTVLVAWQYFVPTFNKVSGLREDLKIWQGKLEDTQALSQKLESLKKKYDVMSDETKRVNQAIPKGEDVPGLLVQLEQLASQNGLILNSVSFAVADAKKAKKIAVSSEDSALSASPAIVSAGAKNLALDLSLTGGQGSFKTFLLAIEENLRIMDVATISFAGKGSSGGTGIESVNQDFRISLNTYFRD